MEEEISDLKYHRNSTCLQDELIDKYFFGIEDRIHFAGSKKEAQDIKEEACAGFDQESIGNLFPFYLRRIVEDMYSKYW